MATKYEESARVVHWVHYGLLSGLIVSGSLLVLGLVIVFSRQEPRPVGIPEVGFELLRHALRGDGVAVLNLGLLVLILTPVLRVAVLVVGWCQERDWAFAAIALSVLILLGISMGLGLS
jgi:uncharacterized membrane protein